jgi:hypothetical protein
MLKKKGGLVKPVSKWMSGMHREGFDPFFPFLNTITISYRPIVITTATATATTWIRTIFDYFPI